MAKMQRDQLWMMDEMQRAMQQTQAPVRLLLLYSRYRP